MMHRLACRLTRAAASAAALALATGLTACHGVQASLSTTTTPPAAPPTATTTPAGASTPAGSLTVSVTSPASISGHVPAAVTCVTGRAYRAVLPAVPVHGDQISLSVTIPRYRGPGSYRAVAAVTLRQPSGTVTTLAGATRVPAVITATGGSFTVSAAGRDSRALTGALSWACGS